IPASWTDWRVAIDDPSESQPERREPRLASLTDLLRGRAIVNALLRRCSILQPEPAADEESWHATDPGVSPVSLSGATEPEPPPPRRGSARRGSQDSRTHHCASRRGGRTNGGGR